MTDFGFGTYTERVERFRLVRNRELPEAHRAAYVAEGIDPDDLWSLIYSFKKIEDAEAMLARKRAVERPFRETWRIVDGGEAMEIERPIW